MGSINAGHPNTIFTKSYQLQNYILVFTTEHSTARYYENELKVTHAQGQIHKKHTHKHEQKTQMTGQM